MSGSRVRIAPALLTRGGRVIADKPRIMSHGYMAPIFHLDLAAKRGVPIDQIASTGFTVNGQYFDNRRTTEAVARAEAAGLRVKAKLAARQVRKSSGTGAWDESQHPRDAAGRWEDK